MPILFLLFLALPIVAAFVCDSATFAMLMVPYLGIALVKLSSLNNLDRFLDDGADAQKRNGVQRTQPGKPDDSSVVNASYKPF